MLTYNYLSHNNFSHLFVCQFSENFELFLFLSGSNGTLPWQLLYNIWSVAMYSIYYISFTSIFPLKDLIFDSAEVIMKVALCQVGRIKGLFSWTVI